ncbi:MAG: hypothetical protein DRJ10_06480 [Bacteroidetes bacterium]|nr:MAG: hypothetical protein DRJ10_06480 [Bacteroidota bacterium]
MKKCIRYKIISDLKLTVEYYRGAINLEDIINFKNTEIIDEKYNPNYNSIGDFRDADFFLDEKQIKEFINYIKKNKKNMGVRKTALLTNTPSQVVTSTLYQLNSDGLPMNLKIFSTLESTLKWIDISKSDYQIIDKAVQNMKI